MSTPFAFAGNRPRPAVPAATILTVKTSFAPKPTALARPRTPLSAVPPLYLRPSITHETRNGVTLHARVIVAAAKNDLDLDAVTRAVIEPEAQWPGKDDASTVYLRGPVAAIHRADDDMVVAVATRAHALEERNRLGSSGIPKAKGCGMGSRVPTDIPTMLGRLRTAGFEVALRGSGHYLATHPDHPGLASTIPQTPSDRRSIPNATAQIRRIFGIDLRAVA